MPAADRGRLVAAPDSAARALAEGLAWLWDLEDAGPRVAFGVAGERGELVRRVESGELAGAVILAGSARETQPGVVRLEGGMRLRGPLGLLDERGDPWTRSSAGTHAVVAERVLVLATAPGEDWGTLRLAWVADAIHRYLVEVVGVTPARLPPIGCLRLDDIPGTAEFQLEGRAKPDRAQARLAGQLARHARRSGSVLNVAVACRALGESGEEVPLQEVWPGGIARLRAGVDAGHLEPVCHGWLGLRPEALAKGEIDYHEFGSLTREEALALLRGVASWQEENLGAAETFVAVDWTYSPGTGEAAAELGLHSWLAPSEGPLAASSAATRETLRGSLEGIAGLDFSPLVRLAELGVPPTVTLHGRSLDRRRESFSLPRELPALLRAFARRDIFRLMALEGIEWLGAAEYTARVRREKR